MKNIKRALHNNCGAMYIDFLVGFLVFMLAFAMALSILPIYTQRAKLDNAANQMLRAAEVTGNTNMPLRIATLQQDTGLDFTVAWDGTDYIGGTTNVQLNHDICLTVTAKYTIGLSLIARYDIPITVRLHGASELYYK